MSRGQCIQCGYDLSGLDPQGQCPECGGAISDSLESSEAIDHLYHSMPPALARAERLALLRVMLGLSIWRWVAAIIARSLYALMYGPAASGLHWLLTGLAASASVCSVVGWSRIILIESRQAPGHFQTIPSALGRYLLLGHGLGLAGLVLTVFSFWAPLPPLLRVPRGVCLCLIPIVACLEQDVLHKRSSRLTRSAFESEIGRGCVAVPLYLLLTGFWISLLPRAIDVAIVYVTLSALWAPVRTFRLLGRAGQAAHVNPDGTDA
ncbi:MAG: hypothetical protein IT439_09285 [Phycisphaerales bacterium]|nr:hypothetical protein [Phycisphaerales bacterium]